jgi:hypothetical protein
VLIEKIFLIKKNKMKTIITTAFLCFSFTAFSQERTSATSAQTPANPRNAATSVQATSNPLPYNVEDKYMGRQAEFLNMITLPALPLDFPLYDKQWSVKDYNAVIDAYLMNHPEILKPKVKEKIQLLQERQK